MTDIKTQIQKEIKFYRDEELELNPSFAPTQPKLLELLDHYLASKYLTSDYDAQGQKKPFFNVVDNPAWVATKMIDIDVKDVKIMSERANDYYAPWIYGKLLRIWMKKNNFGRFINKIVYDWPRYGHVVSKRVGDNVEIVPMRNLISDPTATGLYQPIIEKHRYTLSEFEREAKNAKWENYEDVIKTKRKHKENFVDVYERYGYTENSDDNYIVVADEGKDREHAFEELTRAKFSDNKDRYRTLAWEGVWGRFLGRGQCEKMLENQIAKNETEYFFRSGLKWTSLRIFQTRDQNIAKNVLTDLENGDILRILSELQPVATEERNLTAFSYADQKWNRNRNERAFSWDIMKGERPAAGTPLGTSVLQSQMASGYFGFMKENLASYLGEMIKDWVIPKFHKQVDEKTDLIFEELSPDEHQTMRRLMENERTRSIETRMIARKGRLPSPEEARVIREISKTYIERKRGVPVPKHIFENIDYKVTIDLVQEQVDTNSRIATAQMLIQLIGSNPAIFENPRMKNQIYKVLDWAGMNPHDMFAFEEEVESRFSVPAQGGSISAPKPVNIPNTREVTTQA